MQRTFALMLLVLCACPGGLRRPQATQVLISGAVTQGGYEGRGDPLEGASVVARRGDTGAMVAKNVTSPSGGYRLDVPLDTAASLTLTFSAEGHAPAVLALDATPHSELTLGVSLEPLEALACTDQSCDSSLSEVRWASPPLDAVAEARAIEVALDRMLTVAPPGNAHQVLALAWVSLGTALDGGDGDGGLVTTDAGLSGELRLRVPSAQWPLLDDAVPGSGDLEVQAAAFDVATSHWVALGPVPLFTESGLKVPETALAELHAQAFSGGVVAALPAMGPAYLAVLGGSGLGCVQGTIDADGQPGLGATVSLGANLAAADARGAFCAQAPLSSAPLVVAVQYAGLPYRATSVPAPTLPGTCGGTCVSAGTLSLKPDGLIAVTACSVRGTVTDSSGQPVTGAVVVGYDASVTPASFTGLCGATNARCKLATATDLSGHFSLVLPVQTDLTVRARTEASAEGQRFGGLRLSQCPKSEVTLTLNSGRQQLTVTATWTGDTLTWDPPRAASHLTVLDVTGAPKWDVESAPGMLPPVTLGHLPAGAHEAVAATGPGATGDSATVLLEGTGADGVQYFGVGAATR